MDTPDPFADWMAALEARHLADLRVSEVTRALRALSSAYVERRHKVAAGSTLDSRGKRAAFALYYAPLHFLAARLAIRALGIATPGAGAITDLGCGTGAAGAAWALERGRASSVLGFDRHPWAIDEARWTYRALGLRGHARHGDASKLPMVRPGDGVMAAYVLNELAPDVRDRTERHLIEAAQRGAQVVVVEPIARAITPWWDATAARMIAAGGRADEWRFQVDLPPIVRLLARSAGLQQQELTLRTLFLPGVAAAGRT